MGMTGETVHGVTYDIETTRGVTFSCYNVPGAWDIRATVEDGVITLPDLPDELDAMTARAWASVLLDAADELERQG